MFELTHARQALHSRLADTDVLCDFLVFGSAPMQVLLMMRERPDSPHVQEFHHRVLSGVDELVRVEGFPQPFATLHDFLQWRGVMPQLDYQHLGLWIPSLADLRRNSVLLPHIMPFVCLS